MPRLPSRAIPPWSGRKPVQRDKDIERMRHSAAWLRLRKHQLAMEPLCRSCRAQGRYMPASEVDHIRPHKGDPVLFYDENNLQSLCRRCHNAKTAREDGGWGNPMRVEALRRER